MTARLRSDIQVSALQRQVEARGLVLTVLSHGHDEGGLLFVKWVEGREAKVFAEGRVGDGRGWLTRRDACPERDADAFLESERAFDPDLWVLEVLGPFGAAEDILYPLARD